MAAHTTRYDSRVVNAQQRSECRCRRVALNALMEAGVTQRSPYSHQRMPLCVRTPHTLRAVCVSSLRSSAATVWQRSAERFFDCTVSLAECSLAQCSRRKWLEPADALLEHAAAVSYIGAAAEGRRVMEREKRERASQERSTVRGDSEKPTPEQTHST